MPLSSVPQIPEKISKISPKPIPSKRELLSYHSWDDTSVLEFWDRPDHCPCRKLLRAILYRAVRDARGEVDMAGVATPGGRRGVHRTARQWFCSDDDDQGSFAWLVDLLGWDDFRARAVKRYALEVPDTLSDERVIKRRVLLR